MAHDTTFRVRVEGHGFRLNGMGEVQELIDKLHFMPFKVTVCGWRLLLVCHSQMSLWRTHRLLTMTHVTGLLPCCLPCEGWPGGLLTLSLTEAGIRVLAADGVVVQNGWNTHCTTATGVRPLGLQTYQCPSP